ncbi:MAG: hypothetical protein L0L41_00340 [Acetobacter sp.]|nr:hypothetical protein [Acetobacter sp.]
MKNKVFLLTMATIGLSACTWVKPGTTQQDLKTAKYACLKDAHRTWHWTTMLPIPVVDSAFWAADEGNFYEICMESKGWQHLDVGEAKTVQMEANSTLNAATTNRNLCTQQVREKPEYGAISRRLPDMYTANFSFAQMSSNDMPTSLDSIALETYFPAMDVCHQQYMTAVSSLLSSEDKKIFQQRDIEKTVNASELTRKKISYGEYATRENQSIENTKLKLSHGQ